MRPSRRKIASLAAMAGAMVLHAACTVGPDYETPVKTVPDIWQEKAVEGIDSGEAPVQTWWESFGDETLIELIHRAEEANLDLRQAVSRIRESRARYRISASERYPQVNASGDARTSELSETGALGDLAPVVGGFDRQEQYTLGVDASWEIDVFGRIRRSAESATAAYEATIEDYRDVLVTLFAEVARNYIDVRSLQLRMDYAASNVEAQRESLQLTRDRFDAGLVSALDVAQAESNLANSEAQIPFLRELLVLAMNRLAVLLGEAPGELHDELGVRRDIPHPPDDIAVGLPADLLRQRPDVRRAERDLASQTARIGVATADLYPRFSLTGFLGLDSADLGDLIDGDSVTWNLGLPFVSNLFSGGRVRANIEVEKERTEQLLAFWELSVLTALEDVENSMTSYSQERLRLARLEEAVDASERSVELVRTQYLAGLTNFQNLLDSQRSLFNQQDELAESEGEVVKNLIGLYKALGGGWRHDPDNEETYTTTTAE